MERLKNHKGHNSMLVVRPADAREATLAWKMAMENPSTPTALILARQNITSLPVNGDRWTSALRSEKGAYIVQDDVGKCVVLLLVNGSDVATLVDGAALLRQRDGLKVRVVSVPSEGVFRSQTEVYQDSILSPGIPRFGMTAGLSVTLAGLVSENGQVWGMDVFGYSAAYKVLDEKLGSNSENVYQQVIKLLGSGPRGQALGSNSLGAAAQKIGI